MFDARGLDVMYGWFERCFCGFLDKGFFLLASLTLEFLFSYLFEGKIKEPCQLFSFFR